MDRDGFVFYRSFYNCLKNLSIENRDELSMAIFEYALNWIEPELEWMLLSMFDLIRPQIDANNKRYINWCKGGQYWAMGWRPPKDWDNSQKPQTNPNETPTEPQANPNETPKDKEKDKDKDKEKDKEKNKDKEKDKEKGKEYEKGEEKETYRLPANAGREGVGKKFDVLSLIHTDTETEEEGLQLDEAWKAYKEMRKKIKKPLTEYAEKLRANDLVKLWATTKERVAILNQSIASWWQDLYELKDKPKPKLKWNMYH